MSSATILSSNVTDKTFKTPAFFKDSTMPSDNHHNISNNTFTPPSINVECNPDELAKEMAVNMEYGIFQLQATKAPFGCIKELFSKIDENPVLACRVNNAYTKNLVYKNAYGNGQGGEQVDEKKVIDLSPSRLDTIVGVDSKLSEEFGQPLQKCLEFFDSIRSKYAPNILKALSIVIGDESIMTDNLVNYRMVDYPMRPSATKRSKKDHGPRCGAHRDFGTFTLIFSDGVAGLEVQLETGGNWKPLNVSPGSAVLLFGWCVAIRANDRVPATIHRVSDGKDSGSGVVPRRTSAVFFLAPSSETILAPKLLTPNELPVYRSVTAMELKNNVGRKWRYREGTLSNAQDVELEKIERRHFPTQDDVISHLFKINN